MNLVVADTELFVCNLILATSILYNGRGRKVKKGYDWYDSVSAKIPTRGGVICAKHELRISTTERQHWIFLRVERDEDTKLILAELTMEVWNKSKTEENIFRSQDKSYTFDRDTFDRDTGYGQKITTDPTTTEVTVLFGIKKWRVFLK